MAPASGFRAFVFIRAQVLRTLAGAPGYEVRLLGELVRGGGQGTSASAPLWAKLIARVNAVLPVDKQPGFLSPLLFQNGPNGAPGGRRGVPNGEALLASES